MNEPEFVTVLLRMVERILSIGIAAMTIYFGYRLFTLLPNNTTGDGSIELPNFKVVLSKMGPGVFFVAFGVFVVYQSFSSPIKVDGNSFAGTMARDSAGNPGQAAPTTNDAAGAARLRRDIEVLNCVQSLLAGGGRGVGSDDLDRAVRDAKVALAKTGDNVSLTDGDRVEGCGAPPPATRAR